VAISVLDAREGARVFFSGREATDVTFLPDGRLSARTPMGVLGPALVTVMNPDGLQGSLLGGFTYLDLLEAGFCSPGTGKLEGGDLVVLSGAGFQRGATVTIGGVPATAVRVLTPGHIQFYTPPGPFGPADVLVENPDGRRAVAPGAYFYSELQVTSIIGRHDPLHDGTEQRPAFRLPRTTPGRVVVSGGTAWVLAEAEISVNALDYVELAEGSRFGALSFVDVRDPFNASVIGVVNVDLPYEPADLAVRGDLAYVVAKGAELELMDMAGEGAPALFVFDAADKTGAAVVAKVPFKGEASSVALADDLALVAAGPKGLAIFSIVDPVRPVLLGYQSSFLVNGTRRRSPSSGSRLRGGTRSSQRRRHSRRSWWTSRNRACARWPRSRAASPISPGRDGEASARTGG
jgi:hypothetical protein